MEIKAGDHQIKLKEQPAELLPKCQVKINGFTIPLKPISPMDGEELRNKDRQMNGSSTYTTGVPAYWWWADVRLIEIWPAASHNMEFTYAA